MTRYARLCPPPLCRVVMRPVLLRPPLLLSGRTSDFSGCERVISTKSATLGPRRPGDVGLYLRIAMGVDPQSLQYPASAGNFTEDVDGALAQRDDRALGVLTLAEAGPGAPGLALAVRRVHRADLDLEDRLDGVLDLGLVRARVDEEGVLPLVDEAVALLGDHRGDDDVPGVLVVLDAHLSSSSRVPAPRSSSSAAAVNTTSSLTRTS